MNKSKLEDRKKYVKEYVSQFQNRGTAIKRLADKLFLSEKTIRKDLK